MNIASNKPCSSAAAGAGRKGGSGFRRWSGASVRLGAAAFLATFLASAPLALATKEQIGFTQLQQEYPLLPAGRSLVVLQAEGAADWTNYAWAVPPGGQQANRLVTYLPSDVSPPTNYSDHAMWVAELLVGSTSSIIPQAPRLISCQNTYYINNLLRIGWDAPPSAVNWDLENHSWAWSDGTWSVEIVRRLDWQVDQHGLTIVGALANGDTATVPYVLASAYNVIAVGRSDGGHSRGGTLIEGAGRCKPELVAPEDWTSNATPVVASCAGLLIDQAKTDARFAMAGDPRVIKALLMAGATKEEFPGWANSATRPLDAVFGAGQVNIGNSYRMLVSGRQPAGNTWASGMGWDKATSGSGAYFLEVPAGQAATFSAVLAWHRTIAPDALWSVLTPTVADLNLRLSTADAGFTIGTLVAESRSPIDNVEHVFQAALPAGRYVLEVTGPAGVPYGIAWRSSFPNDGFLRRLFVAVLGRLPDPGALASFGAAMTGGRSPAAVLGDLYGSAEFAAWQIEPVIRLYYAAFARMPDYGGLRNWSNALHAGALTLTGAADQFAGSPEFLQTYGSLNNTQFVQQLYRNVLGREADTAGLADWVGRLDGGASRGAILTGFSESDEFKGDMADRVEVLRLFCLLDQRMPTGAELQDRLGFLKGYGQTDTLYALGDPSGLSDADYVQAVFRGFLRRDADAGALGMFGSALAAGTVTHGSLVGTVLNSTEFNLFVAPVSRLYLAALRRVPDQPGLDNWVNYVRAGTSLQVMADAFAASQEFTNRYGAMSNGEYVAQLYRDVLGREADPDGRAHWTGLLDSGGTTRGQILIGFSESQEAIHLFAPTLRTFLHYFTFLNAAPTQTQLDFWKNYLGTLTDQLRATQLTEAGFINGG